MIPLQTMSSQELSTAPWHATGSKRWLEQQGFYQTVSPVVDCHTPAISVITVLLHIVPPDGWQVQHVPLTHLNTQGPWQTAVKEQRVLLCCCLGVCWLWVYGAPENLLLRLLQDRLQPTTHLQTDRQY